MGDLSSLFDRLRCLAMFQNSLNVSVLPILVIHTASLYCDCKVKTFAMQCNITVLLFLLTQKTNLPFTSLV